MADIPLFLLAVYENKNECSRFIKNSDLDILKTSDFTLLLQKTVLQ